MMTPSAHPFLPSAHPASSIACARVGQLIGDVVVAGRCGETEGRWGCATHGLEFPAALVKNQHCRSPGTAHVLVWVCEIHGMEAPERWDKP